MLDVVLVASSSGKLNIPSALELNWLLVSTLVSNLCVLEQHSQADLLQYFRVI